jgi:hypothetical protein
MVPYTETCRHNKRIWILEFKILRTCVVGLKCHIIYNNTQECLHIRYQHSSGDVGNQLGASIRVNGNLGRFELVTSKYKSEHHSTIDSVGCDIPL